MAYTYPTLTLNNMTFTARRFGQFPTITYAAGATAGSEVATLASDLSNISITIEDGVSTNTQVKTAVESALGIAVQSLYPSDLVSIAITAGHETDAVSAVSATAMTGALAVPAPEGVVPVRASIAIPSTMIDWSLATKFRKTLAANTTFTFLNAVDGMEIEIFLTNTASNYTVTWPSGIKWVGGSAPTQTVGAKTDVYRIRKVGTILYATASQNLS